VGRPSSLSHQQLTEAHLPLVRAIARRYMGRGEDLEDLVQLGAVGLIKASKRFDPKRGVSFATFATPSIEGEIRRHLRDHASSVRIPRGLDRMNVELRQSDAALAAALGRSPSLGELGAALGINGADVEAALNVEQARDTISISPGESELELSVESTLSGSDDRVLLARSIRALDERERRIVFLRFHADMTERQIARELGISQAHVSRLLARALARLRNDLDRSADGGRNGDTTGVISPEKGSDAPRIPAMGDSELGRTVAEYLELPYHVEVRSEPSENGATWKATVEELPGCISLGGTAEEAVARLRPEMESWVRAALAEQREIPVPGGEAATARSARSHSGRFLVRMPKSLHQQLALAAERENVSLNRLVTERLAASLADPPPPAATGDAASRGDVPTPADSSQMPSPRAFRVALATNLAVVLVAGLVAVVLLVVALQRGI
jgi:RNA polymerase sigma-B factor